MSRRRDQPGPPRPPRRSPAPKSRRAFTLIEAVLSIAITGILLTGMGAALLMSIRAADTGADSAAGNLAASEQLARINAELSSATAIKVMTSTDLAFQVPDRDGDGVVENIEYTWSGKDGDPLQRSYNSGAVASVIRSIRSFSVVGVDRPPTVAVVSSEQTLISCDSPSGASYSTVSIDANDWAAQYARPTFPAGAVSWSITRVRLVLAKAASASAGATFAVSIRTADATGRPTATVLGSTTVACSALSSSAGWVEVLVGPVTGLAANQGVCIMARYISGTGTLCTAAYAQNSSAQPFNSHMMTSADGGSTWTAPTDTKDMRFILLGTYTTMQEQ